jgi:hypothetical protein
VVISHQNSEVIHRSLGSVLRTVHAEAFRFARFRG